LNEDLTEAIALGHDLGHTPFGHAGEDVLKKLLPGGFSHYEQSLRVVDKLEYDGKGLNLTFEVRDGIFKHSKGRGEIIDKEKKDLPATLEGQAVRISDIIAYVNHDIDDAIRAGMIEEKDIPSHLIQIFGKWHASRIDKMVEDVILASLKSNLEKIMMTEEIRDAVVELRDFLYEKVYFSPQSREEIDKTEKILTGLYRHILKNPVDYIKSYPEGDSIEKRAGDFIAGMTDRFALAMYEKLFLPQSWPIL
jgi:dGTPase